MPISLSNTQQRLGRADLHMHTTISDGLATPAQLLDSIAQRNEHADKRRNPPRLDVIAITDHDRLEGSLWAYERRSAYPFEIIPGVEVTSAQGHVLGLWVTQPIPAHLSIAETAAAIHEQGGLAILAHPCHMHMSLVARSMRQYMFQPQRLLAWGLDGVEVHNAGVLTPGSNRLARRLANRIKIAVLGNSDAHTVGAVGSGQTWFPGESAADLREAILQQRTRAKGSAWPLADYRQYTRSLIKRRGQIHPNIVPVFE